jgi:hypothetical protein
VSRTETRRRRGGQRQRPQMTQINTDRSEVGETPETRPADHADRRGWGERQEQEEEWWGDREEARR